MQILDVNTSSDFISRLEKLEENTSPQWGKMNPAQMLKHCRVAMEVPMGKTSLQPNWFIKFFFGKMIKRAITDDSVYKQGLKTAKEFVMTNNSFNFADEKQKLIDTIHEFSKFDNTILDKTPHVLFGDLNSQEWRRSQWKHLDHHWRQFGI